MNSIDFSLWCYPENWQHKGDKGYFGLQKRFFDYYQKFDWQKAKFEDFKKIISPKEDKKLAYLRYKIYMQTLHWLNKNYQGNFLNFFKKYGKNPEGFILKLIELQQYNDIVPQYNIYFYKKAQLLYWEFYLYGFLKNKEKIKQLTIFPDYKIISIFNYFGIIKYGPELSHLVE